MVGLRFKYSISKAVHCQQTLPYYYLCHCIQEIGCWRWDCFYDVNFCFLTHKREILLLEGLEFVQRGKKKTKTNVMFHLILFFFVFSNLQFLAGWIVTPVKSNEFLSWTQYSVKERKKKWTEHIGQRGVIWECFYFMLTLTEGSSLTCLFPLPFPSV